MGKSKPKAPKAPDPIQTAGAQTTQNIETAKAQQMMNNMNQVNPYGSLTYSQTGTQTVTGPDGTVHEIPTYTAEQTLSPEMQALFDKNVALQGGMADFAGQHLAHMQGSDIYAQDYSADRQRVEDALMERMNPGLDRRRENLESRLASQGIQIGSQAYNQAMDDLNRGENDARLGAIANAGQEQSRMTRDAMAKRGQQFNEMQALSGGAQVNQPSYQMAAPAQIANTDVAGLTMNAHNQNMNVYNQQMAQQNQLMGGLFGLGAAGIGLMSDRRVKEDIKQVGKTNDGQNIYSFRYKGGGPIQMGLMAQEVEKKKPKAVGEIDGIKFVDYGEALA